MRTVWFTLFHPVAATDNEREDPLRASATWPIPSIDVIVPGAGLSPVDKSKKTRRDSVLSGQFRPATATAPKCGESPTDSDPIEVAFMRPQTDVYYPGPDWDWISQRLFPGSRALYGGW